MDDLFSSWTDAICLFQRLLTKISLKRFLFSILSWLILCEVLKQTYMQTFITNITPNGFFLSLTDPRRALEIKWYFGEKQVSNRLQWKVVVFLFIDQFVYLNFPAVRMKKKTDFSSTRWCDIAKLKRCYTSSNAINNWGHWRYQP